MGSTGAYLAGAFASVADYEVSGGVPPYSWQVSSGTLPPGLTITPETGVSDGSKILLTGTPTTTGCFTFQLQVNDSTAQGNCNSASNPGCSAAINIVILPPALKVQIPNLLSALNDSQFNTFFNSQAGDQGVPYAPMALTIPNGLVPFFWCQDPLAQSATIQGGLLLNSNPISNCPTNIPVSNATAPFSGAPGAGSEKAGNFFCGNTVAGCYTTQFQVNDSQSPFPATAFVQISMQDLPVVSCSQANQAPFVGNGGDTVNPNLYVQPTAGTPANWAFLLHGLDEANNPVAIAGSVSLNVNAQGQGAVTAGTIDVTRGSGGHQQLTVQPGSGSWYVVGTSSYAQGVFGITPPPPPQLYNYSRGCVTLALTDSTGTPVPSMSFAFTLGGCSNHNVQNQFTSTSLLACGQNPNNQPAGYFTTGRVIEFDDNAGSGTRASGILRLQSSTSGLSGPYAFGLSGWDGNSPQQHYAVAGSLQANSGNFASLAADVDDGGACSASQACNVQFTNGSGSYTTPASCVSGNSCTGRFTGALNLNSQTSYTLAGYMVSANEAVVVTTDQLSPNHPIISGEAITTASSFNTASLQNSHIFHIGGLSSVGPDVSIGVLNFDGAGGLTGTIFGDQAATLSTTTVSATYQVVDQNSGRTVFNAPSQGQTIGAHSFVAYIIPPPANLARASCSTPASCVTGFIVGTDNTAQSGILEFQTSATQPPPPFGNQYIGGDYMFGSDEMLDVATSVVEGDVYATPSSSSATGGSLGSSTPQVTTPFIQDTSYSKAYSYHGTKNYFCPSASNCYLLQPNQALGGSYTIAPNGTGTFGGGVVSVTNGNVIFSIDESTTNIHPTVTVTEQ